MTLKDRLQLACNDFWVNQPNPNWPSHRQAALEVLTVLKEQIETRRCPPHPDDCTTRHLGYEFGIDTVIDTLEDLVFELTADETSDPQPTVAALQATIERKTQRIIDLETENTRLTLALRPTE